VAETAEPHFTGGEMRAWLARLEAEHDNMRAALAHCQQANDSGLGMSGASHSPNLSPQTSSPSEVGLRLAAALWWFWWIGGYISEGRAWLEQVLAHSGLREYSEAQTRARATALYRGSILADFQGDLERLTAQGEESLRLFRQLRDTRGVAWALYALGIGIQHRGDYAQAAAVLQEAVAIFRELDDLRGIGWSVNDLGVLAQFMGDFGQAAARYEESLALFRRLGDTRDIANSLHNLGIVAHAQGNYERAKSLYRESLALLEEVGAKDMAGNVFYNVGITEEAQGNYASAKAQYKAALSLHWEIRFTPQVAVCLALLAGIATAEEQFEQAARLFGAAEALDSLFGNWIDLTDRAAIKRNTATTRAQLGAHAFERAWAAGQAMPAADIIAEALDDF
jgi:tetratricopeptide (TPR) repeat protein